MNRFASLFNHLVRHVNYAHRECENYYLNKKTNFKDLKKNKKYYYNIPIFFRSFLFGTFSIFKTRLNKNFIYNLCYQIIRTLFFRIYIDYLILKKK